MKESKLFTLDMNDFLKGLLMVVLASLISGMVQLIESGWALTFDWETFKPIVMTAMGAGLAYLLKNYLTNSEGIFIVNKRGINLKR